ncbi:MAG: aminoacrylate hydrolase, partial [Caballeronia sp.]|nr:aminoacrylate hydrolase [Caballeronia sp.]
MTAGMTAGRTNSGIHYEAAGSGDALVCISGLGGLASFWRPAAASFADRYRVISFDHPGVGRSNREGDQ